MFVIGGGVRADEGVHVDGWVEGEGAGFVRDEDELEVGGGIFRHIAGVWLGGLDDEFLSDEAAVGVGVAEGVAADDEPEVVAADRVVENFVVGEPAECGAIAAQASCLKFGQ